MGKMNLQHLVIQGSKEAMKDYWNSVKEVRSKCEGTHYTKGPAYSFMGAYHPGGHPEWDPLWEALPRGRLSLPTPTHKRTQASDRHRRQDILSLASFPSAAGRHARLARAQGLI